MAPFFGTKGKKHKGREKRERERDPRVERFLNLSIRDWGEESSNSYLYFILSNSHSRSDFG